MKEKNTKISLSKVTSKKTDDRPPESLDSDIVEQGHVKKGAPEEASVIQKDVLDPGLLDDLDLHKKFQSTRSSIVVVAAIVSLVVGTISGMAGGRYLGPWLDARLGSAQTQFSGTEIRRVELDENSAIIQVVKEANPAVVSIIISKDLPKVQQYFFDPFGDFFGSTPSAGSGGTEKQQVGAGSGFIVSSDGLILTNKHVVADQQAEYTVITSDGKKYIAKVLARDPLNDLAVVKIDATNLATLQFGSSDSVELGQRVIAIGNALGEFSNTVTTGVISGKGRTISAGNGSGTVEELQAVIQTDAAINPGNSGGPLLNLAGQVVGVNTAIDSFGQAVGFAIPSDEGKKVVEDVQKYGKVLRPFIGVRYVILTPESAKAQGISADHGALIIRGDTSADVAIVPGSPAQKAGLAEGDVILEINGEQITSDHPVSSAIRSLKPGTQIILKILKGGKDTKEVLLTLGEASGDK